MCTYERNTFAYFYAGTKEIYIHKLLRQCNIYLKHELNTMGQSWFLCDVFVKIIIKIKLSGNNYFTTNHVALNLARTFASLYSR